MPRGNPVSVMGISLRRIGDYAIVFAEDAKGREFELIRERWNSNFCHNISEHGIARLFAEQEKFQEIF